MKYIFTNKEGKEIEAIPEKWVWGIIYKDKSELKQFGDDGVFHQFGEIKQDEVEMFVMYRMDLTKRIDTVIEFSRGQIFHFYRNIILNAATPEERRIKIYCFGWKNRDGNRETKYHFILPDDRMIISDRDVDLTKFEI